MKLIEFYFSHKNIPAHLTPNIQNLEVIIIQQVLHNLKNLFEKLIKVMYKKNINLKK